MSSRDWCHFAVRLSRTPLHRTLKGGALGYEDEKYSYLIASKVTHLPSGSRIVRRPIKRKGGALLTLCRASHLEQKMVTSKEEKKLKWGDLL